jgi:hypothetical protein
VRLPCPRGRAWLGRYTSGPDPSRPRYRRRWPGSIGGSDIAAVIKAIVAAAIAAIVTPVIGAVIAAVIAPALSLRADGVVDDLASPRSIAVQAGSRVGGTDATTGWVAAGA